MGRYTMLALAAAAAMIGQVAEAAVKYQCHDWKNVHTGASGGYMPGIVFNPGHKGLAYIRADIGGAYRLNDWDHSWTALTDGGVTDANWGDWGIDAIAPDPVEVSRVYFLAGMYVNEWDPNNATILRSKDFGSTYDRVTLPFKAGGNEDGRGLGERLVVDPNQGRTIYLGARSGNGLWKSSDYGSNWAKVSSFNWPGDWTAAHGIIGISWITFVTKSGSRGAPTPHIFVAVAQKSGPSIFESKDAGKTWKAVPGQPEKGHIAHKGKLSPEEKTLYVTYANGPGPSGGEAGSVWKYDLTTGDWTDISPVNAEHGYGGLAVDLKNPGTLMVAAWNLWWPDANIWRSLDGGATWKAVWEWGPWPEIYYAFDKDVSSAPWLIDQNSTEEFEKVVGWWIDTLEIDPFDSNHFLYTTGASVFGSRNLLSWDGPDKKFKLESLSAGIEETAVLDLAAPLSGPILYSALGDISGFTHYDLDKAPSTTFRNPGWASNNQIDYAGSKPSKLIRATSNYVAISSDEGATWTEIPGAPSGSGSGGSASISADGANVHWFVNGGLYRSTNGAAWQSISGAPSGGILAADKVDAKIIYAVSGSGFFRSTDSGATFARVSAYSPTAGSPTGISVNPFKTGDVWVAADDGVYHSVAPFTKWDKAADFQRATHISVGAPPSKDAYPAVYVVGYATSSWTQGVYRSEDKGLNWAKLNDNSKNGFGSANSNPISADPRKYGRIFLGTNGRGIFQGNPNCPKPVF